MHTLDEPRDPDLDWLGCEAMFSVPAFGLPPPVPQGGAPMRADEPSGDPPPGHD